ncbi:MAG: crossover junction endodeoxyribonuclease RuvC [Patescibacteria group bacterium]
MIVLGIDPGTRRVGYGIIRADGNALGLIEAGLLKTTHPDEREALSEMRTHLAKLIARHRPTVLAIEKLFFAKNRATALRVAQARGVILETAIGAGLTVREFAPNEVKLGIAGDGRAGKQAIAKMVKLFLGRPTLSLIDDASDAVAIAILGARHGAGR